MTHVRAETNQSERRVCRVLNQPRSTQRYPAIPRDGDEHLSRRSTIWYDSIHAPATG